jgi:Hemerythrin HHE cation binding domain
MATKTQDAIALLKQDHRDVEKLFEQFEGASGESRKAKLVEQICTALIAHTMIEEEIFYPALKGRIEEDMLDEAYVEHDGAKIIIRDLIAGGADQEFYDAKVTVLSEEIRHHVHEEEARSEGMFAQARQAGVDVDALGEHMRQRKAELLAQFKSEGLPAPQLVAIGTPSTAPLAVPAE